MRTILLSLFLIGEVAAAQQPAYVVEAGQTLYDVMATTDIYRYASFQNARVQFRDGYIKPARMNLNYLLGKIVFIAPKGDTLVLEAVDQLAHVAIGSDTFFFYGGTLLQVGAWKGVGRLLQYQSLREEGSFRVGGYDSNDPAGAVESVTSYNDYGQMRSAAVRRRTTFVRESKLYFWKDETAEPVLLDRRSLEKAFPGRKAEIARYLKDNKINFRSPGDVSVLFSHLLHL